MKTERLISGFVLLPYYLQTKHLRGLKTVNSNGFRLNFFALFKICWVYVECLGHVSNVALLVCRTHKNNR